MKNIEKIKKEVKEELSTAILYIFFSALLFSNFIWIMMSPAATHMTSEYPSVLVFQTVIMGVLSFVGSVCLFAYGSVKLT